MDKPYLQNRQCVQFCTNLNPYLGGEDMIVCQTDLIGQSTLIGQYLTTTTNLWKFSGPNTTINQQQYLTSSYYLINTNSYNNIMYSDLFSSILTCQQQCFQITQTILDTYLLQITFVFYIIGEWDDGSQVGLYISGDTIYSNNMVKIGFANGKYYSSTGSEIYFTNITSKNGITNQARRIQITFQGKFYSYTVQIGFSQKLYGTGSYGFGDISIYQSYYDPKIVSSGLYGIPYKCIPNYYAYNGYCVQKCPPYSYQDEINGNCTDLAYQQSIIYQTEWMIDRSKNMNGLYIIKDFFNNNFNSQTINQIFDIIPPLFNNYQNGQPFSFIGGYNSWGYGSYGLQMNLPIHNQLRIQFKVYLIDQWQATDQFQYMIDGILIDRYYQDNPLTQFQGLSNLDQVTFVSKIIMHTQQQMKLILRCNIQQQNSMSCGVSDLFVLYDQYVDMYINDCYLYPEQSDIIKSKILIWMFGT